MAKSTSDFVTEGAVEPRAQSRGLRLRVGDERRSIDARGVNVGSDAANDLVLSDRRVSRKHVVVRAHPGGALVEDLESRNGTFVSGMRISEAVVPAGTVLTVGDTELSIELDDDVAELPLSSRHELGLLLGRSAAMRRLYTILERVAGTDYTVLIEGETGTGKELVARSVHQLSPRANEPFVVVDCGAVGESVVESELFGHVRGSFTGAVEAREGAFRSADGGTLFLDELNSLPLSVQAKLLRALESRKVRPVGGDREIPVNIRVVAATNRPLLDEVRAGRMREDLFYRLSVVRVVVPPLRERREDLLMLVRHFVRSAGRPEPTSDEELGGLLSYAWPGNVRELRNVIERAMALSAGPTTPFRALPIALSDASPMFAMPCDTSKPFKANKEMVLEAFERRYFTELLRETKGNVAEAARRADMSRRHLFELLRKLGLRRPEDDEPDDTP